MAGKLGSWKDQMYTFLLLEFQEEYLERKPTPCCSISSESSAWPEIKKVTSNHEVRLPAELPLPKDQKLPPCRVGMFPLCRLWFLYLPHSKDLHVSLVFDRWQLDTMNSSLFPPQKTCLHSGTKIDFGFFGQFPFS